MAYRKTAISMPKDVLDSVDRIAKKRGESRSAFITRAVQRAIGREAGEAITRRLDEVYADPRVGEEEVGVAEEMLAGSGVDWSDEGW